MIVANAMVSPAVLPANLAGDCPGTVKGVGLCTSSGAVSGRGAGGAECAVLPW
jgi:hypothetical protein